ncbi:OLC1v1025671C1 [Oldenlandia corymbosa var. corymbosa]|uniref:KAT8 regulatory NSL complex subunit 2 n=1 Tax=Oldenlandia corymbosa var. corymbosa TaxID=529605 RepID=A0AAV1C5V4_OLDCO|nr:OLC1v1025671C1 [Oldenlandia corymbosa var. corymbosa]
MPDQTPLDSNHHPNQRPPASTSAPLPLVMDGLEEDERLSKSEVLTQQEVLKRRVRRLRQLSKIFRELFWSMMEELKYKHREYIWEYGKSPYQEDDEHNNNSSNNNNTIAGVKSENGEASFHENPDTNRIFSNGGANRCGVHGCKSKAMALTKFCQMHILSDAKQKLYKPCNYAIKSSPTGPILCGKPILRSIVPSYCTAHYQKAEKQVGRALKKAGLTVSSTSKLAPKFHVIVAEYVRQIQSKRRVAKKAALENASPKEDDVISC